MADHASIAAARTAGFKQVVTDRGESVSPRYTVLLEKQVTGEAGRSGSIIRAHGQGDTQAAAEAVALAAMNKQRAHRYARSGMTEDVS
jgi:hypothetical protein